MTIRRRATVTGVLAVALIIGLIGTASASRLLATSGPSVLTFTDPVGDVTGAPDITNVTITGDSSAGTISFSITATGLETAPSDAQRSVDLFLDTDQNSSTGSPGGNEYDIYVWNDSADPANYEWDILRWSGSGWQEVPASPTMHVGRNGDVFRLVFGTADLGGATSFVVHGIAGTWDANGTEIAHDSAPDDFSWVYDIAGPTRSVTTFAIPAIGKPVLTPASLKAGKRVTVSFPVTWTRLGKSVPLTNGTVVATLSAGGRAIAHTQSLQNGVARLSFVVPKTLKGKQLTAKVTVSAASFQEAPSVWIDISSGLQGLLANNVQGESTTRSAGFTVH